MTASDPASDLASDTFDLLENAVDDAIGNGEGRVYASQLKDAFAKHGIVVVVPKYLDEAIAAAATEAFGACTHISIEITVRGVGSAGYSACALGNHECLCAYADSLDRTIEKLLAKLRTHTPKTYNRAELDATLGFSEG